MSDFIRADIGKLESFMTESNEAIKEFAEIRTEFETINSTLLKNWDGSGKAAYKSVSDSILDKVTGIQEVLTTINDTVVKDLVAQYNPIDQELGEANRKAGEPEEGVMFEAGDVFAGVRTVLNDIATQYNQGN